MLCTIRFAKYQNIHHIPKRVKLRHLRRSTIDLLSTEYRININFQDLIILSAAN